MVKWQSFMLAMIRAQVHIASVYSTDGEVHGQRLLLIMALIQDTIHRSSSTETEPFISPILMMTTTYFVMQPTSQGLGS